MKPIIYQCLKEQGRKQSGASLVEFAIIAPVLFLIGLGTLQAGLLYHSKTILNYATFEAARVGATRHAEHEPMRKELGIRLAPLIGGDGSMMKAATAIAKSSIQVESPVDLDGDIKPPTKLEILSPSVESFDAWGEESLEYANRRVIPNSHLKHQGNAVKGGLTLAEANLLKIEVTQGVELNVPIIGPMLLKALTLLTEFDSEKQVYYLTGRIPLTSSATVRMQSEAWLDAVTEARDKPYGEVVSTLEEIARELVAPGEGECSEEGVDESGLPANFGDLTDTEGVCLASGPTEPDGSSTLTDSKNNNTGCQG